MSSVLIKQLAEDIKAIESIMPKYVVKRTLNNDVKDYKSICYGNDIRKLRDKLLNKLLKDFSLDKYLNMNMLNDCLKIVYYDMNPDIICLISYDHYRGMERVKRVRIYEDDNEDYMEELESVSIILYYIDRIDVKTNEGKTIYRIML